MKVSSLFKVEKLRSASQLVIGSVAKKTNGAFDILSIGFLELGPGIQYQNLKIFDNFK